MAQEATKPDGREDQATVNALLTLQREYMERIQAAMLSGNQPEVQRLVAELAAKSGALASGSADKPSLTLVKEEAKRPPLFDQSQCASDLDLTVYDGDRDMLLSLMDDKQFMHVASEILEDAEPYNARKDLLKSALKLTPKLAPKVYDIINQCRDRLGLRAELELYVCPDVEFNAFCYPPVGGKYIIGVTSALLERFDATELAFVLGHEIGHALFMHHRFPVQFLLAHGEGHLAPVHAMRLYSWKRNAELSADRIGLLCARDFDAAARAFFKLSSGVTDNSLSFQLREYIDQFADLEAEMAGTEVDPEDWYSTHPFSPMRLKALDLFNRSETYQKLCGKAEGGAEIAEEQLEFQIKKIMSLMEPTYLQDNTMLADLMRNFVFLGGWLVAAANGVIEESEVKALGSLLDPKEVEPRLATMKDGDAEAVWGQIEEITEKLNILLPVVSKLNVIKDLTVIAGADGSVDDTELEALYRLTASLHIRPEFVDHVLESTQSERM
jgi:hypothetical protein